MGILRLAHVDVRTPDLELSTAYYTEVLGLQLAERGEDTVYLKCWDEEDHHSIRLRYDPRTGLDLFSFRVEREDDLAELEKAVEVRLPGAADQPRRGRRPGRVDQVRHPVRADHGAGLRAGQDRRPAGQAEPGAGPAARHARDRAAAARPHADQRRGSGGGRGVLPENTRLPDDRTGPRRQRPPARGRGWNGATRRTTSPSSTGRTARCTTSPSGSTTGTRSARPPTSWPSTACRSTRARPGTG